MRDFNFFDPYLKIQTKPKSNLVLFIILGVIVIALVATYQIILISKTNELEADIEDIDDYLNSSKTLQKVADVENKQIILEGLQATLTSLVNVTAEIESSDLLDDMLFEQVNAQLPENSFLSEVSMLGSTMTVKGYSTEYANIAQFAFNLNQSGGLDNILIPNISEVDGNYLFTVTAIVTKEASNEN